MKSKIQQLYKALKVITNKIFGKLADGADVTIKSVATIAASLLAGVSVFFILSVISIMAILQYPKMENVKMANQCIN